MYRLLIVDDEKMTRTSLQESIPWTELGITEVITAKNGLEALALTQTKQPDIVLTDIRMPKMDGLQLARCLREQLPQCQIIFLTGYADKNYLKTAIQLKAVNYVEKPINPQEICEVIQETVALCDKALLHNQTIAELQNNLNDSKPLLRQALTLELINIDTGYPDVPAKYANLEFPLAQDIYYTVACIRLFWNSPLQSQMINHYQQKLLYNLSTINCCDPAPFITGFDPLDNLLFIYCGKIALAVSNSQTLLTRLLKQVTEITDGQGSLAIGIGSPANGIIQIPQSYRTAVSAVDRQFYSNTQTIFYQTDPYPNSPLEVKKDLFTDFKNCLREDRYESAQTIIENLTEQIAACRDNDLNRVKNAYFHLLLAIYEVALERQLIDPFNEREEKYIWKELTEKRNLAQLADYVLTTNKTIFNQLVATNEANRKIQEITRFIRQHYADNTLSIHSISTQVYLSPTYMCALFKKSTGKTLNEFITETRIAKARELLKNAQLKLYEIASCVGFTDVNYFSTLFKRCVGCTPSEFREKYYR